MNTSENEGIIDILSILDGEDLYSLAKTITQGMLKINSNDDAINGILKYSPNIASILRRKAITRQVLFEYLDKKNINVQLPTTKNDLIDKILEYWNSTKQSASYQLTNKTVCETDNQKVDISSEEKHSEKKSNISLLAEQFSNWFYSMLNGDSGVGSEHFYQDANFKLNIYWTENCDTTVIENDPDHITRALLNLKLQHKLFFNPNISEEGVQGRMDPHGLVLVLACGTVHVENTCVGTFEQVFALARDPFCDNNWKVKNSELNLRSKTGVISQPSLYDGDLTSNLLKLPPT